MIVAGCDVGSLTAKAVIMDEGRILSDMFIRASVKPSESAANVMNLAAEKAGITLEDIAMIVSSGYGKDQIEFAHKSESEILCHAKGAYWNKSSVRMVIDIGGQDAKAIKLDENGQVKRYAYNDKCASGTGRFLEIMAEALDVELGKMGESAGQSTEKVVISNQCVIFAETEVVSLINEGVAVPDILDALHRAVAGRVAALAKGIGGIEEDVVMTGGVAKNTGVFNALSDALGVRIEKLDFDPQLNGALGAALIAGEIA